MNNNLRSLCDQIQEDIVTFTSQSSIDITCTDLNNLCEIVVRNFRNFNAEEANVFPREQSFLITDIEFDVSGECQESELREDLQKQWRGTITPPMPEEELADFISDRSGWCVSHLEYSTLTPANE